VDVLRLRAPIIAKVAISDPFDDRVLGAVPAITAITYASAEITSRCWPCSAGAAVVTDLVICRSEAPPQAELVV